ncbi:MAG: DUF1329 domain-containing protein [Desulfatitalea sp.]|nr:DUF1329 domain-containing protein [Desulfatitalea sp.]NNK01928.1 DUF1329 domain-containing protein [Desulfatitalea sp.]
MRINGKREWKMKNLKMFIICLWVVFAAFGMRATKLWAGGEFKLPAVKDIEDNKKFYDDPRPWYTSDAFNYKKILPPDVYSELTYDVETMKKLWAEIVGFKAPDVVNKTAPEIKPGVYSCKDKEQYPGLKMLMTEYHYNRFKPGAPPFAGNFPEMKIVPTRQYYNALSIAEATKNNTGKTMLNDKTGIIEEETYMNGYPFPMPEGKFKANQIYYNWLKRYWGWDSKYGLMDARGFSGSLREDFVAIADFWKLKLKGRVMDPPGWFDKRAQLQGESDGYSFRYYSPRDLFGNVIGYVKYLNPDKFDQAMLYVATLRRVRLMSATDVQDSVGGADAIYLDDDVCTQKLSTKVFPSKMELIAERELLLPNNHDGSAYVTSPAKGVEYHNLEWERRPVYVLKMTILDKNFVYGHRIIYIDRETFFLRLVENYDRKGRLYRTNELVLTFVPEMGMATWGDSFSQDHLDFHTSIAHNFIVPVPWLSRDKVSLEYLYKTGK